MTFKRIFISIIKRTDPKEDGFIEVGYHTYPSFLPIPRIGEYVNAFNEFSYLRVVNIFYDCSLQKNKNRITIQCELTE